MVSMKYVTIVILTIQFFMTILALYILGLSNYLTDFEKNTCDMTYMFEYPQYVRITLRDDIEKKFPRFGLYAYGEGQQTEKLRRMFVSGIPVLFIPGNAGSHEQVRSIASVSLRKSLKKSTSFHFDFFTISFNKDLSAIYGGVLMEQTAYVSHCIRTILSLYKSRMDKIILIGHSMGGIIAKGALVLTPHINASFASMIMNLATPNTPSVFLDSTFSNYYHELRSRSHEIKDAGVKVVSIGGGPRDLIVTAQQTFDSTADINVLSTSIPTVWKSTDHLSILWCKQLVLVIVRSLFDSVDISKRPFKITSDPYLKMQALSYNFLQLTSGKNLYPYTDKLRFAPGVWVSIKPQHYVWNNKNLFNKSSNIYLVMKLFHESNVLTIDAVNLEDRNWLFVCTPTKIQDDKPICEWGWNLTNKTRILPDIFSRMRRTVDLDYNTISHLNVTHVVVRITPNDLDDDLTVGFDPYYHAIRVKPIESRVEFTYLIGFRESSFTTIIGDIRYYVPFSNLMNAIAVEVKSPGCSEPAIVELTEPWNAGFTQVTFFPNTDSGPKTMKLQSAHEHRNKTSILRVTLNPECIYTIKLTSPGIIDKVACRIRDRWPLLYLGIISLLLLLVSVRVNNSDVLPTVIVTIVLSFIFGVIYEICIAVCVVSIATISICFSVVFLGYGAHGIAVTFLSRAIAYSTTWSDWLLNILNQLPFITTTLILSIIPATCGSLVMLISVFLSFLKLTTMYEDCLGNVLMASLQHFNLFQKLRSTVEKSEEEEEEEKEKEEESQSPTQKIYDHLILLLLWISVAIPAIPSVLVWAKNFSYDMRLTTEDPVLLTSWVILVACSTSNLIRLSSSKHKSNRLFVVSSVIRFASWLVLTTMAAPHPGFYYWYIPPVIASIAMLITLNSVV